MSLITANNTYICIANQNHWPLTTMSADWGPFNDWSLWVLIEDLSMTDHYECCLRTVQFLITMSAVWGQFNDWSLYVLIGDRSISNGAHFELCRESRIVDHRFSDNNDKELCYEISSVPRGRVNVSVRDLLTVFVPYFVNIAFLFLSVVSGGQFSKIFIWNWPCASLYHIHVVILLYFLNWL